MAEIGSGSRRSGRFSVRSKQLGRILMENGDVQAEQIAKALKIQEQRGGLIGFVLRELGACSDSAIAAALLKQVQVSDIRCADVTASPDLTALVSHETCMEEKLCPFERLGDLLCIVMGNPLKRKVIEEIELNTKLKVKAFKAPWGHIQELVNRTYTEENIKTGAATANIQAKPANDAVSLDLGEPAVDEPTGDPVLDLDADLGFGPEGDVGAALEPQTEATDISEPAPISTPQPQPTAESGPAIEGLDDLSNPDAVEIVEADERGLRKKDKRKKKSTPRPPVNKEPKKAKVNVDLDTLDLSRADKVVDTSSPGDEPMEEIVANQPALTDTDFGEAVSLDPEEPELLGAVSDDSFYESGSNPPAEAERSSDLEEIIDSLPEAEIVADCMADWRRQEARQEVVSAVPIDGEAEEVDEKPQRQIPMWAQLAPIKAFKAEKISDDEFNQTISGGFELDPEGEWDFEYAGIGPIPVSPFEEAVV